MLTTTKISIMNSGYFYPNTPVGRFSYKMKGFIMQSLKKRGSTNVVRTSAIDLPVKVGVATVAALMATGASAALDPAIATAIAGAISDIATLGALVFSVVIAVSTWKWLKPVAR